MPQQKGSNLLRSHLLCERPGCYHSASKTYVRDRFFKLSSIHDSVIYPISWIQWIPLPCRKFYSVHLLSIHNFCTFMLRTDNRMYCHFSMRPWILLWSRRPWVYPMSQGNIQHTDRQFELHFLPRGTNHWRQCRILSRQLSPRWETLLLNLTSTTVVNSCNF